MGRYDNALTLVFPFPTQRFPTVGTKKVQIDKCIALEVIELWNKGVETVESCCGHNKTTGYISVCDYAIQYMIDNGYVKYPDKEDTFYPKSVTVEGLWEAYSKYRNMNADTYLSPVIEDFNWFIKNYPNV